MIGKHEMCAVAYQKPLLHGKPGRLDAVDFLEKRG
jgi:hypothetical protein